MALFGGKKKEEKASGALDKGSVKKADKKSDVDGNYSAVLMAPRITEKAAILAEKGTYVFEVPQDATKEQVFEAVKQVYKVEAKKISMVRMKQQNYVARSRGRKGKKSGYKKAYIHVKKGDRIEVL